MLRQLVEADLRARGRAPRTIYEQGLVAQDFEAVCGLKEKYGRADVIKWLGSQREKGNCDHTIQVRLWTIKLIFDILELSFPELNIAKPSPDDIERPTLTREQVEQLILRARAQCPPEHLCRLAVSTTYGLRRIELARLSAHDLFGKLRVNTAKGGRVTEHLIPLEIQPFIIPLKPCSEHWVGVIWHRICEKTGMEFPDNHAWHAIRRALATELILANASALNVLRFMRWSDASLTRELGMLAIYARKDQERIDQEIFALHPFLPFWKGAQ